MLYIINQVVATLWLTIIERTVTFRSTANLQVDMPYIKPVCHISNLSAIYQTCPYLNPWRGWGPRYLAYQPPFCTSYDISSACDVTAHHLWRNSPVSAAVRRRPFCRLICHITNLRTILKLLWWRRNHVICAYNVCEVVVGGGDGELMVVCSVYVLVHMCAHEAREQLGKRKKKKKGS